MSYCTRSYLFGGDDGEVNRWMSVYNNVISYVEDKWRKQSEWMKCSQFIEFLRSVLGLNLTMTHNKQLSSDGK